MRPFRGRRRILPPSSVLVSGKDTHMKSSYVPDIEHCTLESFAVIGIAKENNGLYDGNDAVWQELERKVEKIHALAKRNENGELVGIWGLLNNERLDFRLTTTNPNGKILFLAGLEAPDDAVPPKGFTKWVVPAGDYLYAPVTKNKLTTLNKILQYADGHGWEPNGYPFDFMQHGDTTLYTFFPVRKA